MKSPYESYQWLTSLVANEWTSDILIAETLYNLKKDDAWMEAVGEGVNSWVDFLAQPEINVTKYRADKLIRIYEYFVVDKGFELASLMPIPLHALDYISKKGELLTGDINTLLDDAVSLSAKDFKEKYHDTVTDGVRTYSYMVMKKCNETGNLSKVHGIESDLIKQSFNLE